MRKSTLLVISFLIAFPIVYFGRELLWSMRIVTGPRLHIGTTALASSVLAPIISVILNPLNRRLLACRKARGRDIEEEERYETDNGMIRLTPTVEDEKNHSS